MVKSEIDSPTLSGTLDVPRGDRNQFGERVTMFPKRQESESSAFEKEWEHRTGAQLDEHDRQSKHADEQSHRFDRLLDKWEEQARRQDAILDAMEKQYGIRK